MWKGSENDLLLNLLLVHDNNSVLSSSWNAYNLLSFYLFASNLNGLPLVFFRSVGKLQIASHSPGVRASVFSNRISTTASASNGNNFLVDSDLSENGAFAKCFLFSNSKTSIITTANGEYIALTVISTYILTYCWWVTGACTSSFPRQVSDLHSSLECKSGNSPGASLGPSLKPTQLAH